MMPSLKDKIKRLIAADGPMRISQFMNLALSDPTHGYYHHAKPFGREGDFITAPEISQMFGEILAIWAIASWQALGKPKEFVLCEIGPGRGTLMADIIRTFKKLVPQAYNHAKIYMVETSAQLINIQKQRLANDVDQISWVEHFDQCPNLPIIIVANELFDALPIDQYVKIGNQWRERVVALNDDTQLIYTVGQHSFELDAFPNLKTQIVGEIPDGTIIELSPWRNLLMQTICEHINNYQGTALLIDYGETTFATGDTLQAMTKHQFSDVFSAPGQHDLTSHVDFASLKAVALKNHCLAATLTQGQFLLALGLLERAGKLGEKQSAKMRDKITADVHRLASPDAMGQLFKVLTVSDKNTGILPIFN